MANFKIPDAFVQFLRSFYVYMQRDDHIFFKEKIEPHYSDIIRFLTYASGDEWLAYDITQTTMEDAWKYIKRMRSYDSVKAALIAMAKNNMKKYYKKHPAWIPIEEITEAVSDDKALEDIITAAETDNAFKELFLSLDEKYTRVLMLHHYYELSLKEIAEMLGKNYNTVLSWHTRALKILKEKCTKSEDFKLYVVGDERK